MPAQNRLINGDPCKAVLLAEIGALRLELWHEWWDDHTEYCGTRWPHADETMCGRPPPKILAGHKPPGNLARPDS